MPSSLLGFLEAMFSFACQLPHSGPESELDNVIVFLENSNVISSHRKGSIKAFCVKRLNMCLPISAEARNKDGTTKKLTKGQFPI